MKRFLKVWASLLGVCLCIALVIAAVAHLPTFLFGEVIGATVTNIIRVCIALSFIFALLRTINQEA